MPVRPFASQEIELEHISKATRRAIRQLEMFQKRMRKGRARNGGERTQALANAVADRSPDIAGYPPAGIFPVIPVGTNAEFNAAGEVQITPPLSTQKRE
jgi:hypothetical protein